MSEGKKEAPGVRESVCLLCRRSEADPDICGGKLEQYGLCAHVFCLFFANDLFPQRNKKAGFLGVRPKDIQHTIDQAAQQRCFICGQSGATITCCEADCHLSFHLPCAKEAGCVTQYITPYRSFCPTHSPEQTVEATPETDTKCLICMEPVEDRKTFNTMVCPACKTAWFHRNCIQNQAIHSGFSIFCCPHCQNEYRFPMEMLVMGIRIPRRPWELLLCCSCAAEGTHRSCSGLRDSTSIWECNSCAGLGTATRDDLELPGPYMDKQLGLEPSHSPLAPDTISPSTSSAVPSRLSLSSLAPETSSTSSSRQGESGHLLESPSLETSSPSSSSQVASCSSHSSSPQPVGSSCSTGLGSNRRRNCSRLQRQAPNSPVRSRSPRDRSCVPAPSAERCTPSQVVMDSSQNSPALNTSSSSTISQAPSGVSHDLESGRHSSTPRIVWIQDHSCLQHQAQDPNNRPGSGTCRAPSPNGGPDPTPPGQ